MSAKAPLGYRLLLLVLPPRFRRDFGADLEAVLVERLRDAPSAAARIWIWLIAVVDVFTSAPAEWAHPLRHQRTDKARGRNAMDHLKLDLRFALRSLARRPGFAAIAVTTLALGIGASIAIFSVVNTVLLKPFPYPDAERIVSVETFWTNAGRASQDVSGPDFLDWQAQNDMFEYMAAYNGGDNLGNDLTTVVGDRAVFANARFVSADFFAVFGQTASAGRLLTEQDVPLGAAEPTVGVVAYHWAEAHFGSAEAAVGKVISVYGNPLEIVGVAAPGFRYPGAADLWAPWRTSRANRNNHDYRAVGKLEPDVDLTRAQAQMRTIGDNLARQYSENRLKTVTLVPLQERLTGNVQVMLWVLMGAVIVVLLIACANISNLLLARAAVRTREVGLLVRSFQALQHVDLGFTTERVLIAYTDYAVEDVEDIRTRSRFYTDLLDRLRTVPGVSAAAGAAYLPMGWEPRAARDLFIQGRPDGRSGERPQAELYAITPDYFETLQIPIRAGRDFDRTDASQPGSPSRSRTPVAIINEALARTVFPGESPLGRHVRTNSRAPWMEIVGVVGDARWQDPRDPAPPAVFVPSTQDWGNSLSILARTSLDERSLASTLRGLLYDADPTVPVRFETMKQLFAEALTYPRFRTQLMGAFAGVAVLLAAVGIFSVLAYLVGQRTREIAVRRAVGAQTADVIRLIVGQGLRLVAVGLVLGLAGAVAVARLLEGLLYEISPWNVGTYLGVLVVLGVAALLAILLPTIRAAAIAPLIALRQE